MSEARPVIKSVPTIAGPIPPSAAGATCGGMGLLRNDQLMTEAPREITVHRTNPSGIAMITAASTLSVVPMRFLVRRQDVGSRRSGPGWLVVAALRDPPCPA